MTAANQQEGLESSVDFRTLAALTKCVDSQRFVAEVVATLLDEDIYLCSEIPSITTTWNVVDGKNRKAAFLIQ